MVICYRVYNTSKLLDENVDVTPDQGYIINYQRIYPYSIYRYNALIKGYTFRDQQDYPYKGQDHDDVSHGNPRLFRLIVRTQEVVELRSAERNDTEYRFGNNGFFVDQ